MAFQAIDLVKTELPTSNLFHHLPRFEEIYYQGHPIDRVQLFRAVREGTECKLLAVTVIRKDEDFLWDSTKDLVARSVRDAASLVRGIYAFDLLTFDVHSAIESFNCRELTQVLVNSSLRLKPGEQMLIKYSSVYGILQKMVDESWGKIVLKTAVELFNDKPNFLFALVSKILKTVEFAHAPVMVLINDLSTYPLHDPQNAEQKAFLDELIARQRKNSMEFPPEVFIQDLNGRRELFSGIVVKQLSFVSGDAKVV
ncbi:MAG: hypothetical protein HQL18_01450 [Candidatus Omnitrophica bacterium]|nr:hypothetical protein [Candidatus Omnitrophota bacterium]